MSPFLRRVAVPVATVWASPADGPEDRETQLLHGERVLVVAQHDGWSAVRATGQPCSTDPRGYPGWVRTDQLSEQPPTPGLECVVARPSCLCSTSREGSLELSFGTRLQVLDGDGPVATVALSGGGQGAVPRAALRRLVDGPPTADDVLASARLLLDVPYVWGGTSAWGLYC